MGGPGQKKIGDPTYRDIGSLGALKKKESKTVKTLVTMRFDGKDYYVFEKNCTACPSQAGGFWKFINGDGQEVEMEVSEDEEEEQEEKEEEQKEDVKEQKVEEGNDDDDEGGDDEGPPVYNPSPYTPLQVAEEKEKLTAKGFDWVLGSQTVDPSSDRPRHKARTTMDQKFDIDPTLFVLPFLPLFIFIYLCQLHNNSSRLALSVPLFFLNYGMKSQRD